MNVSFGLNGNRATVQVPPFMRLLDILRNQFRLESLQAGCRRGECGTCLVLLDGDVLYSCLIPAFRVDGRRVRTVEGLVNDRLFAAIESALADTLCEFCSSAVKLIVYHTLSRTTRPTPDQVRRALSCIACHCAGFSTTFEAVIDLSRSRKGR